MKDEMPCKRSVVSSIRTSRTVPSISCRRPAGRIKGRLLRSPVISVFMK